MTYEKELARLSKAALDGIKKMEHPLIQFCGPISTGGFGNTSDNITVLKEIIRDTKRAGIPVFDQMKYEKEFDRILKNHKGYDLPLLENFYGPVIGSGLIDALFFIPLWESSYGSKWEFDFANRNAIKTVVLGDLMINSIINEYNKLS